MGQTGPQHFAVCDAARTDDDVLVMTQRLDGFVEMLEPYAA
jgi:hypothetical protein